MSRRHLMRKKGFTLRQTVKSLLQRNPSLSNVKTILKLEKAKECLTICLSPNSNQRQH